MGRIALEIDVAKLVQLDRRRFSQRAFRLRELPQQLGDAGGFIVRGLSASPEITTASRHKADRARE